MIRPLGKADWKEFRRLRLEALTAEPRAYGDSAEEFAVMEKKQLLAFLEAGLTFGGFVDGRLEAIGGLYRLGHLKARHKMTIWGVFVAPAARRQGMARRLLEALIAHARTVDGVEQVDLSVGDSQAAARALYASLGFRFWGREPHALKVHGQYVDEEFGTLFL